jgi:hypothetical protein
VGKVCRNCGKPANRPRQLCWGCYYDPSVRDRFPSTSKYANKPAPASKELADCERAEREVIAENIANASLRPDLRLRRIIEHSGEGCTLTEARSHLAEDGLSCTAEEFDATYTELFPPDEDWHRPLGSNEVNNEVSDKPPKEEIMADPSVKTQNEIASNSAAIRDVLRAGGPKMSCAAFIQECRNRKLQATAHNYYGIRRELGFATPRKATKIGGNAIANTNGEREPPAKSSPATATPAPPATANPTATAPPRTSWSATRVGDIANLIATLEADLDALRRVQEILTR